MKGGTLKGRRSGGAGAINRPGQGWTWPVEPGLRLLSNRLDEGALGKR